MAFVWKLLALLALLPERPYELWERLVTVADVRLERCLVPATFYEAVALEDALELFAARLGPLVEIGREVAVNETEQRVRQRLEVINRVSPFDAAHSADIDLARFCYVMTRAMRPQLVLETGVAFGVTSAFILAALHENGQGVLHSIDLPPLARDADRFVGAAIPETLKPRWNLHRGSSRRLLPRILHAVQAVDIFVHDSLHTYRNMRWEFDQVWPRLGVGGMIIADDIQGNGAFEELRSRDMEVRAVIREHAKGSLFGVVRKRGS